MRITDIAGITTQSIHAQSTLPVASPEEATIVKTYLEAIERAFKRAEKSTAKYFVGDTPPSASNANTGTVDEDRLAELAASLTLRAERRQKDASLTHKVTWSLHDRKSLQKLADVVRHGYYGETTLAKQGLTEYKVSDNVSSLIELFPAERFPALQERQLVIAQRDVQEIAPTGNIDQLQQLAATAMQMDDPWLRAAAESAGEELQGHLFSNIQTTHRAKALFGDDFAKDAQDPGTRHSFHNIVGRGEVMASYGNRVGWQKSFWDDSTLR